MHTSNFAKCWLMGIQAAVCAVLTILSGVAMAHTPHIELEAVSLAGEHPDQAALEAAFEEAAADFGVPASILKAVAFVESRWVHAGPTVDYGYGIMHLVDNSDSQTLILAAKLTDYSVE
ncbi:MAG: hypothetical protein GXY55_16040, partial [Phycisphaerae bacterium]|nr:hypothetical protein [Phycisphaerae bacterium]